MDPKKDLNVSGNKIINVAEPLENDHVATKHYVDHLHIYSRPDSNAEEYIRYINARNVALHSLAALCTLETSFGWVTDPKRTVFGMVDPYIVLESTTGHCLFVIQEQDLTGKTMTVEYMFPVEVQKWEFRLLFEAFTDPDEFIYVWQASNDKVTWVQKTQPEIAKVQVENWNGCDGILSFTNTHSIGRYRYWRVRIQHGKVTKAPYFNIMLMTVG